MNSVSTEELESRCILLLRELMPTLDESRARVIRRGEFPWDSLKHIELINEIEKQFKLQVTAEAALRLNDLPSMVEVIFGVVSDGKSAI